LQTAHSLETACSTVELDPDLDVALDPELDAALDSPQYRASVAKFDSPQFRASVAQFVKHAKLHRKAENAAGRSNRAGRAEVAAIRDALKAAQALQRAVGAYPAIAKWHAVRSPLADFQADIAGLQRLADALRLASPEARTNLAKRPKIEHHALTNLIGCIVIAADKYGIARPSLYDGDPLLTLMHQAAKAAKIEVEISRIRKWAALVMENLPPVKGDKSTRAPPHLAPY
jgi:hypothetical protein